MQDKSRAQLRQKWAHLRFSIIGPLLASPPRRGELKSAIGDLAARTWRHPRTGEAIRFGHSTIERWVYAARAADDDPVGALRRQVRKDRGQSPSMSDALACALKAQHKDHPSWSYTLHAENLCALAKIGELGSVPSTSTVRRYMKRKGLFKIKRRPKADTEGARQRRFRATRRAGVTHQGSRTDPRSRSLLALEAMVAPIVQQEDNHESENESAGRTVQPAFSVDSPFRCHFCGELCGNLTRTTYLPPPRRRHRRRWRRR